MIDFLKSEVLRLQGAVEEQRTTVSGQICQAVLNDNSTAMRRIFRENPTIVDDGNTRAIITAMAKNAETKQIETMVGNMDVERRLLDEVTLAGNSMSRDFARLFHAFDKDGDGFITFQDVVAEVEKSLRHSESAALLRGSKLSGLTGVKTAVETVVGKANLYYERGDESKILTPQALILGDILEHAARGKGVVCHIDDLKGNDPRVHVQFAAGDTHRYNAKSLLKGKVNFVEKGGQMSLTTFWTMVPGSVTARREDIAARNKRDLYFNPLASRRYVTERALLQAVLKDDVEEIECLFLFEDADDQMKNPVGLPLVDFARERGKSGAFRALVLWNRVYATCSRAG